MRHNPERNLFSPLSSVVNATFHNIRILTQINIYQSFQNSLTLVSLKQNSVNKNVRGPLWSISVPQFNVYSTNYSTAQKLKLYSKYLYSNATFLFTIYPIGSFLNVSMLQNLLLFSFYFHLS